MTELNYQKNPFSAARKIVDLAGQGLTAKQIYASAPELGLTERSANVEVGRLKKLSKLPDQALEILENSNVSWSELSKFLRMTKISDLQNISVKEICEIFELENVIFCSDEVRKNNKKAVNENGASVISLSNFIQTEEKSDSDKTSVDEEPEVIQESVKLDEKQGVKDDENRAVKPEAQVIQADLLGSEGLFNEGSQEKACLNYTEYLNGAGKTFKNDSVQEKNSTVKILLRRKINTAIKNEIENFSYAKTLQKIFSVILVAYSIQAVWGADYLTIMTVASIDVIFIYAWVQARDFSLRSWARALSFVFVLLMATGNPANDLYNSYQTMSAKVEGTKAVDGAVKPEEKANRVASAEADEGTAKASLAKLEKGTHISQVEVDKYEKELLSFASQKSAAGYPNPHVMSEYKAIEKNIAVAKKDVREARTTARKDLETARAQLKEARDLPVNTYSASEIAAEKSRFASDLKENGLVALLRLVVILSIVFLAVEASNDYRRNKTA